MTTPATDSEMLVYALYHSAVVSGRAAGSTRLGKMAIGGIPPKLDFTPRDVGMVVMDVAVLPWRPRTLILNRDSFQPIF